MLYLYRLLRPDEEDFETEGLSAKDPYSSVSVNDHVTNGSRGPASSYISCCKSPKAVENFAYKSITCPQTIVKIEIDLNDPSIEIIDLTDPWTLDEYVYDESGKNYARKFEEVLIKGYIPPEYISIFPIEDWFYFIQSSEYVTVLYFIFQMYQNWTYIVRVKILFL